MHLTFVEKVQFYFLPLSLEVVVFFHSHNVGLRLLVFFLRHQIFLVFEVKVILE